MGIFTDIYNELVVIQEENQKQKKIKHFNSKCWDLKLS